MIDRLFRLIGLQIALLALVATASLAAPDSAKAADCNAVPHGDFMESNDPSLQRLTPKDCKVVRDNPINFAWQRPRELGAQTLWTLKVRKSGGEQIAEVSGDRPRATLPMVLPTGRYEWQVTYLKGNGSSLSGAWRRFQIDGATTTSNNLPTAQALLQRLNRRLESRLLRPGMTWHEAADTVRSGTFKPLLDALIKRAEGSATAPLPASPDSMPDRGASDKPAQAAALLKLMHVTNREFEHIEVLTFAWRFTRNDAYLQAARQRILNLTSWDPAGASAERQQPQANRNIYLALALAVDLLGNSLPSADQARVADVFARRIAAATDAMRVLDIEPYRSFENTSIHYVVQALALVAGRHGFEAASQLLLDAWPLYVTQPQAWGDDDGSNGASVAYAWYDLRHVARTAAVLLLAADVDVMQLSQPRKIGDYLIATTTPNQQHANAFGDGLEVRNLFGTYAHDDFRLYAELTRKPTHNWYWRQSPRAKNLQGYVQPLHLMLALLDRPAVVPEPPTQDDQVFEDTGIAAFHSDIASTTRNSVIFRAGRFGAFNHGHADQNAFVFNVNGQDLLISSGFYPYYNSPHHAQVTRATRYKNAVTFDGGIGQSEPSANPVEAGAPISSMATRAELVNVYLEAGLAVATGDARLAYRGRDAHTARWAPLLTEATRSVAYFKTHGVVVVYDSLRSEQPRRWEWNYHAVDPFTKAEDQLFATNGANKACIDHYGVDGRLTTSDHFDIPPEVAGQPRQYHARFTAKTASKAATAVAVIRINCSDQKIQVEVELGTGNVDVSVQGRSVRFQPNARQISPAANRVGSAQGSR